MDDPTEEEETAIKQAVHYTVGEICSAEEQQDGVEMSKDAITVLAELTYHYTTSSLANDLAAFSTHRGSKTINVDDVKLVARKDPNKLLPSLEAFCAQHCGKAGGKSTVASSSSAANNKSNSKQKKKKANATAYFKQKAIKDNAMINAMNVEQRRDYFLKEAESSSSSSPDDEDVLMTDAKRPAVAVSTSASAPTDIGKTNSKKFHLQILSSGSSSSSGSDDSADESNGDSSSSVSIVKQKDTNKGATSSGIAAGQNENIWSNLSQSDHEDGRNTKKSDDVSIVAIDLSDDD